MATISSSSSLLLLHSHLSALPPLPPFLSFSPIRSQSNPSSNFTSSHFAIHPQSHLLLLPSALSLPPRPPSMYLAPLATLESSSSESSPLGASTSSRRRSGIRGNNDVDQTLRLISTVCFSDATDLDTVNRALDDLSLSVGAVAVVCYLASRSDNIKDSWNI
ncbi:hypothetical protein J5N97_008465 [Dioscorea zingiberensis]|uniref:Uncharacterized protein n=1 Tax=Dioscorea zingiberensis TaxID=325984 RepID=A0A9D5CUS5_9LILI|nr:hypothetical protein J5N97_008465 [Dioscorea zingiberensis]